MTSLKKILTEKGVKQQELANQLGVSKQYINNIANGRQEAGLQTIKEISRLLDVPLWRFFYEDDGNFVALIEYRNKLYSAKSIQENRRILDELESDGNAEE